MIAKIWSGQNKLYWLQIPFSLLYGLIVLIRRKLYQLGIKKSQKLPVPVIIVGNLSVGGNGKTPLVIYLVEQLRRKGLHVGVISRGYGGKSAHYPLIIDENTTAKIAGDEPVLIYQRTQVPLAISPNRYQAAQALLQQCQLQQSKLDVIISDDGLQHYALQRDIEIVVIDAKRQFGNGWYLPAGPMRERPNRLKQVDYMIINGESNVDMNRWQTPLFTMKLEPSNIINLVTKEAKPLSELTHICAMAGIGDPERFFTMLQQLGADLQHCAAFNDHQVYTKDQLQQILQPQQNLLMTEKDAVKCMAFAEQNWWYLPIDAQLSPLFIDNLVNKINKLS